jgi:hypothetical protein
MRLGPFDLWERLFSWAALWRTILSIQQSRSRQTGFGGGRWPVKFRLFEAISLSSSLV